MSPITNYFPIATTIVMFVFTASVFQRYAVRRNPAFLFWGIGLLMFGLASLAEVYLSYAWNSLVFGMWYVFGAALTAAWIGLGTVYLLFKKPWVRVVTIILVVASLVTAGLMWYTPLNSSQFQIGVAISEQYRSIMPPGAPVRFTFVFNICGVLALVGGALYSAFLFWRKRVLPNRVIGNALIAAGALVIASASSLTRLGYGQYLYIGELVAAILMYSGFLMAAAPGPATAPVELPQEARVSG